MKKLLGLLLVVIVGFTACGSDEDTGFYSTDFTIRSNQWQLFSDEEGKPYYELEFEVPQLTRYVFETGVIACYLVREVSYDGGAPFPIQNPLPYTYYGYYTDNWPFSENYSYEISAGYINFIVKNSEFDDLIQPMDCTFRLVLAWKE